MFRISLYICKICTICHVLGLHIADIIDFKCIIKSHIMIMFPFKIQRKILYQVKFDRIIEMSHFLYQSIILKFCIRSYESIPNIFESPRVSVVVYTIDILERCNLSVLYDIMSIWLLVIYLKDPMQADEASPMMIGDIIHRVVGQGQHRPNRIERPHIDSAGSRGSPS